MQFRRDVFYIAGYDPRGYRYYYSLFKKNLNLYNERAQSACELSKVEVQAYPIWHILSTDKSQSAQAQSTYTFLAWNDIVRANWHKGILSALQDCLSLFRIYIITGLFFKFAKSCKASMIAGFYPFLYVLFSYALVFVLVFFSFEPIASRTHIALALGFDVLLIYLATKLILKIGNKTAAFWLLRICIFCARWARGKIKDINARTDEFAKAIFEALAKNQNAPNYELILCAHSVGTILAVSVAFKVIRLCKEAQVSYHKLKILTLGECVPLMSYHKGSNAFKEALQALSEESDLIWYDFTSKIDGACFYKVDFLKDSGISAKGLKIKLLSAEFYKLYSPEEYAKIRRDWYRAHFLYLCASKIAGRYDFFKLICAPSFLEEKIKI